jgi:RimJ/RimL family protein N-acetyltransferase
VNNASVQLRPVHSDDLWLFERQAVDPDAGGNFNWSGYKNVARIRNQLGQDGLVNQDGGRLCVLSDGVVAGNVLWNKATYGIPEWWCWNIGIALLPEFRGKGIGSTAQLLLVNYLFDTTAVERVEAYTDVENKAEQRALEHIGFTQEGTLRAAQFRNGQWCDLFLYSLLRRQRNVLGANGPGPTEST